MHALFSAWLACSGPTVRAPDALPVEPIGVPRWLPSPDPPPAGEGWGLTHRRLFLHPGDTALGWEDGGVLIRRRSGEVEHVHLDTGDSTPRGPAPREARRGELRARSRTPEWVGPNGERVALPQARDGDAWDARPGELAVAFDEDVAIVDTRTGRERARARLGWAPQALSWSPDGRLAIAGNGALEVRSRALSPLDRWELDRARRRARATVIWSTDGSALIVWLDGVPYEVDLALDRPVRQGDDSWEHARIVGDLLFAQGIEGRGLFDLRRGLFLPYNASRPLPSTADAVTLTGHGGTLRVAPGDVAWVAPLEASWLWLGDDQLVGVTHHDAFAVDPRTGRVRGRVVVPRDPDCRLSARWPRMGDRAPLVRAAGLESPRRCPERLLEVPNAVSVSPALDRVFTEDPPGLATGDRRGARVTPLEGARGPHRGGLWSEDGARVAAWSGPDAGIWDRDGARVAAWTAPWAIRDVAMDRAGSVLVVLGGGDDRDGPEREVRVLRVDAGPACTKPLIYGEALGPLSPGGDRILLGGSGVVSMLDLARCERVWTTASHAGGDAVPAILPGPAP